MAEGSAKPRLRWDEGHSLTPLFQRHQNRITHRIPRSEHVRVPDAQHLPPLLFQKPGPRCIMPNLSFTPVRRTINLNNQLRSRAGKIREVWSDWKLPHKLETIEPAAAQFFPQPAFSLSVILAEGAGAGA